MKEAEELLKKAKEEEAEEEKIKMVEN